MLSQLGKTIARQKDQAVVPLGGSAPARTALDVLAETVAWEEADDASNIHDGSTFSQLTDLSGNGADAVQPTAGQQPARLDTSGVISAEYNGSTSSMTIASAGVDSLFAGGGTIVLVMRPDSDGEGNNARILDKEPGWVCQVGGETGGNVFFNLQVRYSGNDLVAQTGAVVSVTDIHVIDLTLDSDLNDASDIIVGLDGALLTEGDGLMVTDPTGTIGADTADMFLGNEDAGARSFDGGFYALALWDTKISDTDIALVRAYFADKYGVTLA